MSTSTIPYEPGTSTGNDPSDAWAVWHSATDVGRRTLVTRDGGTPVDVAGVSAALAAAGPDAVVLGALGFDPATAAGLRLYRGVTELRDATEFFASVRGGSSDGGHRDGGHRDGSSPDTLTPRPHPAPEGYEGAVAAAVRRLRDPSDALEKVVLGRLLELSADEPVDPHALLGRMLANDPGAFGFALPLPRRGGPARTLVGASPELLVARHGRRVTACPLAGSRPRSADPLQDEQNAAELLASAKDLAEHAVVADAVRAVLSPLCADLEGPTGPQVHRTATMWHLATPFSGLLLEEDVTALDLFHALHPTPAVCGTPLEVARAAIAELEPFDREYFAGAVGWVDGSGDGEWAVTIRCAEVSGTSVRLFAGAGIVADSEPAAELAETSAKFRTSARALGLADDAR